MNNELVSYYIESFFKDLEDFKHSCITDKYSQKVEDKLFFVQDLEKWSRANDARQENIQNFIYFLVIHIVLLMLVHKYFRDKYKEFKKENKGIVFEYGLTNTFMTPSEIFKRLHIAPDKERMKECFQIALTGLREGNKLCGIKYEEIIEKARKDKHIMAILGVW